jgi:hypothetical protein
MAVSSGHRRSGQTDLQSLCRSVLPGQRHTATASVVDSQAQSASSILVTRSNTKPQASGPGLLCCLDHFRGDPALHQPYLRVAALREYQDLTRALAGFGEELYICGHDGARAGRCGHNLAGRYAACSLEDHPFCSPHG